MRHSIIQTIFFFSVSIILLASCKEVGPTVNLGDKRGAGLILDTVYQETVQTPEVKNVLLEDFTGIRCINCPNAQQELKSIIAANGGRVIGISHHSLIQDEAYPTTKVELTSGISQKLEDLLVFPGFKPNGAIDRTNLFGGSTLCYGYLDWASGVSTRLGVPTPVNINVVKNFNPTTGDLVLDIKMHYTADQAEPNKVSVFIVEDSIVTAQLMPNNTINDNYVHDHVMRVAISDTLGDRISHDLLRGNTIRHVYRTNLAGKELEYRHLKALVFVHRFTVNKEVLQVKEIELED